MEPYGILLLKCASTFLRFFLVLQFEIDFSFYWMIAFVQVTVACTATYAVVVFILASIPHLDKTTLVTDIKKMVVLNPTLPQAPESSSLYFENHMFGMDDSLDRDDLVDQAYGYLMMNNSEGCCAKCDEQMCPGRSPNNTSGVTKNHSSIHDPLSQIMGLFSVPYPSSFFQLTFPEPQSLS